MSLSNGRRGDPVKSVGYTGLLRHCVPRNDKKRVYMGDGKITATGGVKAGEIDVSGIGSVYGAGSFNIANSLRLGGNINFDISRAVDAKDYLPPELFLNLEHEWFQLGGGSFYEGPWNGAHILGARAKVGKPWLNAEVYGGREVSETWANGISKQYLDRSIFGVTLAGGIQEIQGRIGYNGDFSGNGFSLLYSLAASPWQSLRIFSSGNFVLGSEGGRNIVAGAHVEVAEKAGISAVYENHDSPPVFDIDVLGRYQDNRGRISVFAEPTEGLQFETSVWYGEKFAGADASLGMKGTTVHGGYSRDLNSETDLVDFGVNVKVLAGDRVIFGVHAEGSYDTDSKDWWISLGGNAVYAPFSWLTIIASASEVWMPHGEDGWDVRARTAFGFGGATDRTITLPYSSRKPVRHDIPIVLREFGALMKGAATSFSHKDHLTEYKIDSCMSCHSDETTLIVVQNRENRKECKECHDTSPDAKLQTVRHPFQIPVSVTTDNPCPTCHGDMKNITAPTGGYGQVIIYPHKLETRNPNGVWSHRDRVVDNCGGCHTDDSRVQFDGRTVPSCKSCHDDIQKEQSPHSDGFFASHGAKARFGVETCISCHNGKCISCHEETLPAGTDFHTRSSWMHFGSDDRMVHGKIAQESGGALCGVCHAPASVENTCGRCH